MGDEEGRGQSAPAQLTTQVVCQVCGATMAPEAARADGWLVERWRIDPRYYVVRCHAHISEWSLRCSAAGRTKEWRQKMIEGREREAQRNPLAKPFSLHGRPGLPGDDEIPNIEEWT